MKKTYIQPTLYVSITRPAQLLCASPGIGTTSTTASSSNEVLVKEQSSYNVWDDDWSE